MAGTDDVVSARAFQLVDAKGETRAALKLSPEGSPSLEFYDSKGEPRVGITVNRYDKATLFFWSRDGLPLIELLVESVGEHDTPRLTLVDGNGRTRARLGLGNQAGLKVVRDDEDARKNERSDRDENDQETQIFETEKLP